MAEEEQEKWIDTIFGEQPYLANVYPGETRKIGMVFAIKEGTVEYFNLGVHPIFRETYSLGGIPVLAKGYQISERCIGCGTCVKHCPQSCIREGNPFVIEQTHCLHCGNCKEHCPAQAVVERG